MDAKRLTETRERLAKRTQGEWKFQPNPRGTGWVGCPQKHAHRPWKPIAEIYSDTAESADGDFIAAAPADIRDLLEHVEKLEAGLQAIAEWKFNWRGDCVAEAKQVAESALKGGN